MSETLRCPACGALNRSSAEWCGQCLKRFTPPPPPPPAEERPVAVPATPAPGTTAPVEEPGPPAAVASMPATPTPTPTPIPTSIPIPEHAVGTRRGAFTVTPQGVRWTCARCDSQNPIDETHCSVCGAPFAATVRPEPERPARDAGTTAMVSLFFPGAGHAYLGMWGQAIARGILSLWTIGVVVAAGLAKEAPSAGLIVPLFALVAFALWAVAAHDAYREALDQRSQVILKPRYFLYVVMGLLMILFVLLMVGFLGAQRSL